MDGLQKSNTYTRKHVQKNIKIIQTDTKPISHTECEYKHSNGMMKNSQVNIH